MISRLNGPFSLLLPSDVPFMFGFLGSSEELLYVLCDLFGLTDDVLRARHGAALPALLSRLRYIGTWKRAAVETVHS